MTQKVVHYRRLDPKAENWRHGSLQSILKRTLDTEYQDGRTFLQNWESRLINVQGNDELTRFLHNIQIADDSIFGTLGLFLKDEWAVVLRRYEEQQGEHQTLDQALRQMEIAERPPVEGEDYLRGIAYWLVVGDHLFVVQHTSIQTRAFEEYFAQLFQKAGILSADDAFGLRSEFNKAAVGGDLEEISAIEIGGIMNRGLTPEPMSALVPGEMLEDEQRTLGRSTSRFEKARDILKAVFGDPNAEQIINSIPPEAELEVDVKFGYKTSKRGVSKQALRDIARAARNLPDGEVVAIGKGGRQIGDDLRLSETMPFKLVRDKGALLELDDARTKLLRVFGRFVEDAKIEL